MLRVGIAGLGRGLCFFQIFKNNKETEVTAVCDLDERRAREFAAANNIKSWFSNFKKFLESDIDIALIATPFPFHAEQSILALEAGKHVLCEVPPAYSIEEAKKLVQAVKKAKRLKYMMAANMNYIHFLKEWVKLVHRGKIGKVFYAEAEYVHPIPELMRNPDKTPTWRAKLPPIYYCTHSLGPLIAMLGERFVQAIGLSTGSNVAPEFGTIDMEVALLRTGTGTIVKLLCGFSVERGSSHHYFSIYGTRGCLETDRFNWQDTAYVYFKDSPETEAMTQIRTSINHPDAPEDAKSGGHGTSEYYLVQDFIQSILNDTTPPIDVHTALDFGLPGLCAHSSALQGGKIIEIPDSRNW